MVGDCDTGSLGFSCSALPEALSRRIMHPRRLQAHTVLSLPPSLSILNCSNPHPHPIPSHPPPPIQRSLYLFFFSAGEAAKDQQGLVAGVAGLNISSPMNVQRVVHVEWDADSGTFSGLPSVWKDAAPGEGGVSPASAATAGAPSSSSASSSSSGAAAVASAQTAPAAQKKVRLDHGVAKKRACCARVCLL